MLNQDEKPEQVTVTLNQKKIKARQAMVMSPKWGRDSFLFKNRRNFKWYDRHIDNWYFRFL